MQEAWSRLKTVLDRQGLTTADLVRRVSEQGDRVNAKSLYRLADPQEPLEKVDMRVVGAVCQALQVGIGDLLTFDEPTIIEELDHAKQARLDDLLTRRRSTTHALSQTELSEIGDLMTEAEVIARGNARRLSNQKRRFQRSQGRGGVKSDEIREGE